MLGRVTFGVGAICNGVTTRGPWTADQACLHINCLELLGALYALQSFAGASHGLSIIIYLDNFKDVISQTKINQVIAFNFNCDFITNHFGKDKQKQINYQEFSQLIHVNINTLL